MLIYIGIHRGVTKFPSTVVQAKATSLPPILSLLSTVAFSILFGPSAVLLAAPLTLFVLVAVEALYVEQALGEPTSLPGHRTSAARSADREAEAPVDHL